MFEQKYASREKSAGNFDLIFCTQHYDDMILFVAKFHNFLSTGTIFPEFFTEYRR